MKPKNLETRVVKRLAHKKGDVFLRDDFSDLGGYDQVGRVLCLLVSTGQLVKIVGYTPERHRRPATARPPRSRGYTPSRQKRSAVSASIPRRRGLSNITVPDGRPRYRQAESSPSLSVYGAGSAITGRS